MGRRGRTPTGVAQANSWLGRFPYDNQGVGDAAAVGSYPPNGYGLYDMTGNVWEWTTDYYTPRHLRLSDKPVDAGKRANLLAAASAQEGFPAIPRRVLKGGSHLCSPDYCLRFRPAARSPAGRGHRHVAHRLPLRRRRLTRPVTLQRGKTFDQSSRTLTTVKSWTDAAASAFSAPWS